ncbi:MAG: fibronectin type III domain-containing protein, partial [Planctomycetes bacterium]|nr:fibronectin type III domain-containing protein [Planctomycetota bacterium]
MIDLLLALLALLPALRAQDPAPTEPALVVPKLEDSETFPPDGLVDQRPAHWRVVWTEDPQRQALILWDTAELGREHRVLYDVQSRAGEGAEARYAKQRTNARSGRYTGTELVLHWHAVPLDELTPDTTYFFVLESDGLRSPEMHFRTAPASAKPVALLSGGDARSDRAQRRAVNRMLAQLIDLRPEVLALAHGGDYVLWGTQLPLWDRWLRDQELVIGKSGRLLPILPTRGNHEATGPIYDEVFGTPGGVDKNYYATMLTPEVLLVTLNTEIAAGGDQ